MKRDLHIWKETYYRALYICTYDVASSISRRYYVSQKRPAYMKRDLHIWKKETYYRGLCICTYDVASSRYYICRNRDLCRNRDKHLQTDQHICGTRHVKRDVNIWKETYERDHKLSRDLLSVFSHTPDSTNICKQTNIWDETYKKALQLLTTS